MKIEDVEKYMESISEFLEYHEDVLEGEPYKRYVSSVTSIDVGYFGASIHINEEAFDRVIQNPKVVFDYGCDPLGVTVIPTSSTTMQCSFVWNDVTVLCVKDLDTSKLTCDSSQSVGVS